MLGFEITLWDYLTFATAALAGAAVVVILLWIAGLPGQIAIARKHPEAEAVKIMGQEAEIALDLYPGQIFEGKVEAIWQGSGQGQMLPSGRLPRFVYQPTDVRQGQFAVAIHLEGADQSKFPIGTQGRAAIYTNPSSGFVVLRKIGIRAYTWFNWLYLRIPVNSATQSRGKRPPLRAVRSGLAYSYCLSVLRVNFERRFRMDSPLRVIL